MNQQQQHEPGFGGDQNATMEQPEEIQNEALAEEQLPAEMVGENLAQTADAQTIPQIAEQNTEDFHQSAD